MIQYHKLVFPKDKEFGLTSFKHEDVGLKGVMGRPYVDLSKLISQVDFDEIDYEIGIGLVKNKTGIPGSVRGQMPPALRKDFFRDIESEVMNNLDHYDPDGRHRIAMRDMNRIERQKYGLMVLGAAPIWHQLLYVRNIDPTPGYEKISPYWTDEGLALFPKVKALAEKLPFKFLGRILIFASYPHAPIPPHRDWVQAPHKEHHINISGHLGRPIYVFDELKNEKIYLPENVRAYMFNLRDYHGVDGFPRYSYTLKFEGLFSDELCAELEMPEGFVWK